MAAAGGRGIALIVAAVLVGAFASGAGALQLTGMTPEQRIEAALAVVGIIAALVAGDGDPGFIHNGALAGLVAVCAGSDVMHPIGAFITGGIAGAIFVFMFQKATNEWKIDDVNGARQLFIKQARPYVD